MSHDEEKKSEVARREEEILTFWEENNIFQKSLDKPSSKGGFVFYDGPPFATGLPHYGHILPGSVKDAIPRYQTMRGYNVRRQWGWDCHGLPVENEVEKEFNLKTKKDIEELGVDTFNAAAKESVMRFADDWRRIIPRTGRWVDMDNDYRTMDWTYTESVWWVFKTLYDKGLIYEGFKSMHLCPRCETTLSNLEVSQGYTEITDIAVTVKLKLSGKQNTSLLVWTTTPWTLPGNMAAAVNPEATYVKVLAGGERFILAKDRLEILKDRNYKIERELKGGELVGEKYKPPFDYYKGSNLKHKENAWKVYGASYVSTNEGTGIVHIAPAFGEEDLLLAQRENLPIVHHVGPDGRFKKEVLDFAGMLVKPKGEHQKTDIEIIKYLANKNLLFAKEKIVHAYPHCWRCETPLLNFASVSWFVKVTAFKGDLLRANKKINWIPRDIRDGRFGKWLLGARDWAISRTRFWGAPIPVWKCTRCDRSEVVDSVETMKKKIAQSGNSYFIMRHGNAVSNQDGVMSSIVSDGYSLTEKGKEEVAQTAKGLKKKSIDIIFSSPLKRTKETAKLVANQLGLDEKKIIFDDRLREIGVGVFEGESIADYRNFFSSYEEKFTKAPPQGENLTQLKERTSEFLHEVDKKYSGLNILFISHGDTIWMLFSSAEGASRGNAVRMKKERGDLKTGEVKEMKFMPFPHNKDFELDLHRPYIDEVKFPCSCGGTMLRTPEVFDCWFESGSMPYGQFHYPFDSAQGKPFEKIFNPKNKIGFPADFIAEGLDQTRGWFYSLLVLSVALFGKAAFKNVVVSGLVLAEDGQKMSKRLKNYPDPVYIINRYGADALRYYLLSSPVVRGEDLNFSEKSVHEAQNKVITRLRNVCAFYELYTDKKLQTSDFKFKDSDNILDRWIRIRLMELVNKTSYFMDRYELDRSIRPIGDFIDDLSTWYLRRSRERFKSGDKEDKKAAIVTTRLVLQELARVMAPFMPFVSEEIFQKVKSHDAAFSVHLENWPKGEPRIPIWPNPMALVHRILGTHDDLRVLSHMQKARDIVSLALEARASRGLKVRQPLSLIKIKEKLPEGYLELIKDEVNVKNVIYDQNIEDRIELDTNITPELKKEGQLRELIRNIQDLRKKERLTPNQKVVLAIKTSNDGEKLVREFKDEIKKATSLEKIEVSADITGESVIIDNLEFTISVKR